MSFRHDIANILSLIFDLGISLPYFEDNRLSRAQLMNTKHHSQEVQVHKVLLETRPLFVLAVEDV
jgi:hypothetical protein